MPIATARCSRDEPHKASPASPTPKMGAWQASSPVMPVPSRLTVDASVQIKKAGFVEMLPIKNCHPQVLLSDPREISCWGCNVNGSNMPAIVTIINNNTGKLVATVPGIGGPDMVKYDNRSNRYYIAEVH
jgi:hypothetical protein